MKRINILFIFIFSVPSATFSQQSDLLEKYRSMAVEYNHDLKVADKHISASIELEKAARKDLRPKLSGDANFQYTGNPIQLTLDLPSMQNPLTFEGKDMKYGASLTLLQPVYTGGRLLETSGWQNINIVWQHIRRNTFVPPCATKPICNTGIP